jgi:citronellol/citronellal dehydrogenase
MSLAGKTIFMTGGSRGIGLAIALKAARDGANLAIAAKTAEPHRHLPGTIYTAAKEIEDAGGRALPLIIDVRDAQAVQDAVDAAAERFGGIDICLNNASAIDLKGTLATEIKRYDLMHQITARGSFVTSRACIPYLKAAANPHILNMSPPIDLDPRRMARNVAYMAAKYAMSMWTLGMSEEFRADGIAVNSLWPRTGIATAAIEFAVSGQEGLRHCRTVDIMADAAYVILTKPAREFTGKFLIDDIVLYDAGTRDFDQYRVDPTCDLGGGEWAGTNPLPPGVSLKALRPA